MSDTGERVRPETEATPSCGRDLEALLAQVADGNPAPVDAHQRDCPHCRAALARFDRLWSPLRAVARHRPGAPPGVLDSALARIRGVGVDPEVARIADGYGHTRISSRAVATLARHLAARELGVRVALSRLATPGRAPDPATVATGTGHPATSHHAVGEGEMGRAPAVTAGVAGTSTAVEVVLVADYGVDLPALAARVRRVVATGIREMTGLEAVSVSVIVDDVLPPA